MCGIAAVIGREPLSGSALLAQRLDDSLAHRGPDARGFHAAAGDRVLLVHRRLAIIDPSAGGAQPMSTPDGRFTIIYNGEIYNHRELRASLESEGERFFTQSDTEVLVRLIARRGPDALAMARGMFALAVFDAQEQSLLMARDRFGIKPLYVAASRDRVVAASEIGAMLRAGLVTRQIDPAGVLAFLRWGSIPAPLTWIAGVEALIPGTWMRWSLTGACARGRFADARELWTASAGAPSDAGSLLERASAALRDSVKAHLVADVPVGVFLSSGMDSAALVSLAARQQTNLHTYTVDVDESGFSEARAAERIAERFGTVHHELRVTGSSVMADWPLLLQHMDQPTADGVNTFYVARAVAATGVKAVLSGVGGDEAFGGYPSFRRIPRGLRLSAVPALAGIAGRTMSWSVPGWRGAKWRHFAESGGHLPELYRALRGFFMPDELDAIAGPALTGDRDASERVQALENEAAAPRGDESVRASVARLESTFYMRSQLLRDVDAFGMAHALEIRVPFVDAPLVSSIWPALGNNARLLARKRLLVEAVGDLPEATRTAPKRGFTLPFERWVDGPLSETVRSGITALVADGWLRSGADEAMWRAWQARDVHWSRMWGLGVLGHFLRSGAGS
jgi:asparagine synthase (glutamine-hydrolysing)